MKKKLLVIVFTLLTLTGIFAQGKVRLKIATIAPARSPWDIQLKKLAQEWNKITNGQVSIKFYNMTNLGGEKSGIQRMKSSRPGQRPMIDGAILSPVGLNELAPEAKIFTLEAPFLIQNQQEFDIALNKYGNIFEKKIEAQGCKLITWTNVGWLSFYTKKSYSTLPELKKIKTTTANDTQDFLSILKICGFNAYGIHPAKFNQELKSQNGAQGFSSVHILTYTLGLHKDISYILDERLAPVIGALVISEESWKLIPEKYKDEMLMAVAKMKANLNNDLEKMNQDYLNKMMKTGVKLIKLNKNEKEKWNKEFYKDMERVNKIKPNVLNMDVYKKIVKLLESYRK